MWTYYRTFGKEPMTDLCKGRLGQGQVLYVNSIWVCKMNPNEEWSGCLLKIPVMGTLPGDSGSAGQIGSQESVLNKHWANVVLRVPTSNPHKPFRFRFCSYFTDKQTTEQKREITYAQSYNQEQIWDSESTFLTTDPGQLLNHTEPWVSYW